MNVLCHQREGGRQGMEGGWGGREGVEEVISVN